MFGELTVLGFIALCTYFMIKGGLIEWASLKIYHDPEHLLHLFEVQMASRCASCCAPRATPRARELSLRSCAPLR